MEKLYVFVRLSVYGSVIFTAQALSQLDAIAYSWLWIRHIKFENQRFHFNLPAQFQLNFVHSRYKKVLSLRPGFLLLIPGVIIFVIGAEETILNMFLSLHRALCSLFNYTQQHMHTQTHTHIYIYYLRSLKFTLKHLKRSYMLRSYDHPPGVYIIPC